MKKIILITVIFVLIVDYARSDFLGIYDNGNEGADDSVWVYISMWDSLALKFESPDTIYINRFDPSGDTLSVDTITSLTSYNYADGFYMKRYRAGGTPGQYTVNARGSGNGNYYSLANHAYFVNDVGPADFLSTADSPSNWGVMKISGTGHVAPDFDDIAGELDEDELASETIDQIADSTRQLVWKTLLVPGYPSDGDTASSILYRVYNYVDGNGSGGIDADIENISFDIEDIKTATDKLEFDASDSLITKGYTGGVCSVPDSLLEIVTKIDTMYVSIGRPGVSGQSPSLHMKIGLGYDGQAGTGNVQDHLDSLTAYTGKHNLSVPGIVSLHNKFGDYPGSAGPGNNVKDDISAIGATGGGTEPETLIVLAAADSTLIQGARATIRTLDQSTTKVCGLATDVSGRLILALDPGGYWIEMTANNYIMAKDTLDIVSGGGTDTLLMSMFDPGNPPEPYLCRVYGWVYDISGDSLSGIEITAEISREYHPVKYENAVITPFTKSTVTDSTGYWSIDLIPSELLSNASSKYMFTIKYQSGVVYRTKAIVPGLSGWQMQ
ncbi:MAG: hypothetical protein GY839_11675 [candidate division Zixibacteria bacterium]|nr:hypothetical protein [candidate division Zixibacteria bacterium]